MSQAPRFCSPQPPRTPDTFPASPANHTRTPNTDPREHASAVSAAATIQKPTTPAATPERPAQTNPAPRFRARIQPWAAANGRRHWASVPDRTSPPCNETPPPTSPADLRSQAPATTPSPAAHNSDRPAAPTSCTQSLTSRNTHIRIAPSCPSSCSRNSRRSDWNPAPTESAPRPRTEMPVRQISQTPIGPIVSSQEF